jgi:hypothetical protein
MTSPNYKNRETTRDAFAHRARRAVPNGTGYEAKEGARGASAVRKENCQCPATSGGAVAGRSRLAPAGLWISGRQSFRVNNHTLSGAKMTGWACWGRKVAEASAAQGLSQLPGTETGLEWLLEQQSGLPSNPEASIKQHEAAGNQTSASTNATAALIRCTRKAIPRRQEWGNARCSIYSATFS